jgi:uncharacterized protein related to proFAR isomerase
MYIKKDSNTLVVGMPKLANWAATLGIKDKGRVALVEKLDQEIPEIMISLGAKDLTSGKIAKETPVKGQENVKSAETKKADKAVASGPDDNNSVIIKVPKVPEPVKALKVITVGGNAPIKQNESQYKPRSIALKVSAPPKAASAVEPKEDNSNTKAGEVKNSRVSAYLRGGLQSVEDTKKALNDAGFKILSASTIDKKGQLTSIVFTDETLAKMADKKNRGFAASLRVLVDEKNKQISVTNPIYIVRAFMQDDFDEKAVLPILEKVRKAFPDVKNSGDMLKYHLLPKYHFMVSMPYYEDMITVGKGDSTKALLEKAKAKDKNIIFIQPLSKDRTLIGVQLGKRTSKFVKKIGVKNGALLPYPVLIEDGEAKILDPKYYISIMYPMLKMSEFMTISTVPGAIQLDCENLFR